MEEANKTALRNNIVSLLENSHKAMLKNIDKVLNSGCVDIETYHEDINPMLVPKMVLTAILEDEATQYEPNSNMKAFKKEVNNIKLFI